MKQPTGSKCEPNEVEYEITAYLLRNYLDLKVEILKDILITHQFPLERAYFEAAFVRKLLPRLESALGLNHEQVASVVTLSYLKKLLGKKLF